MLPKLSRCLEAGSRSMPRLPAVLEGDTNPLRRRAQDRPRATRGTGRRLARQGTGHGRPRASGRLSHERRTALLCLGGEEVTHPQEVARSPVNACRPWLEAELAVIKPEEVGCFRALLRGARRAAESRRRRGRTVVEALDPVIQRDSVSRGDRLSATASRAVAAIGPLQIRSLRRIRGILGIVEARPVGKRRKAIFVPHVFANVPTPEVLRTQGSPRP